MHFIRRQRGDQRIVGVGVVVAVGLVGPVDGLRFAQKLLRIGGGVGHLIAGHRRDVVVVVGFGGELPTIQRLRLAKLERRTIATGVRGKTLREAVPRILGLVGFGLGEVGVRRRVVEFQSQPKTRQVVQATDYGESVAGIFACAYTFARPPSLRNQVIKPGTGVGQTARTVECRERLGGILRYHHRKAAYLLAIQFTNLPLQNCLAPRAQLAFPPFGGPAGRRNPPPALSAPTNVSRPDHRQPLISPRLDRRFRFLTTRPLAALTTQANSR
ncbi:MAG TPA: hypothetical protein VFW87_16175 [Pirellulales bacterium]|nr:hypothetical protein [Pirellulales bacterium]